MRALEGDRGEDGEGPAAEVLRELEVVHAAAEVEVPGGQAAGSGVALRDGSAEGVRESAEAPSKGTELAAVQEAAREHRYASALLGVVRVG